MRADGPPPVSSTGAPSGWGFDSSARGHQFGEQRDVDPGRPGKPEPRKGAVRLGYSPPVPEGAAHGGQLGLSTRVRASGVVQFAALPPTFLLFFDLLLDLLGRMLVYLNCVIKQFHIEYFLPASFIARRGTETVMAQRTVNQDARPGT